MTVRVRLFCVALWLCAIGACFGLACGSAIATGMRPVIESLSAGAGGEVTVGAKINPEGLDTSYELRIECALREAAGPCETTLSGPTTEGVIPGGGGSDEVRLNVTSLKSGSYLVGVRASNAAGGVSRQGELTIPPRIEGCAEGCASHEPYKRESTGEWDAEASRLFVAEYWAQQRLAQEASAHEQELKAREEARLLSEAAKREAEREAAAKKARRACIVPSLRGDSLTAARRALARAHCRLGKVDDRSRVRSRLAVSQQSPRRGRRLANDAPVSVTLALAAGHTRL